MSKWRWIGQTLRMGNESMKKKKKEEFDLNSQRAERNEHGKRGRFGGSRKTWQNVEPS